MNPERFMRLALAEAEKGRGRTHPNPVVGAVVVKGGRILARGHHEKAGRPHAEVNALRQAGSRARGADVYVTLEPCNHIGRTPPCTEALIAARVRRVIFGSHDPNPRVEGHGAARLHRAGIEVQAGLLREECDASNEPWFKYVTTDIPWVVLKAAVTLDGKLATRGGDSKWISGEESRLLVHRWRDQLDAVLVGAGTARADDPRLTVRGIRGGRNPLRVVLGEIPRKARMLREPGASISESGPLPGVLRRLGRRGLTSVLVEGGARVHAQFLRAGLWDELRLFVAPKLFGSDGLSWADYRGRPLTGFSVRSIAQVGGDVLIIARPVARPRDPTTGAGRRRGGQRRRG
ncbi:MAG TPA: bifunctional diaminohydroxyphosphoribosylaminopyrimidine deaminase/5-amino-6-(5-phosphoribosylamino)uracil reductase RibD [Myxococcales bacterium]|nr:bifunctional diaminohydroxyphosphoribosylaminopyrimidine deaminase/5-amino-6-(5-phosphoribosylamino)uracil reductase RibD [Myxococcales bacterium]